MKQLKELTLDQIKLWKLTNSQLKKQIEVELRNTEQLQKEFKEVQDLLQQSQVATIQFANANIKTFKLMTGKEALAQSDETLMHALLNLRRQNIQLQEKIKEKKDQAQKLQKELNKAQGSNAHDKYTRVMENLSGQQADIRETWDSNDVLKIDDVAIERNVSYDEAKDIVEQGLKEGEVETEDV